MHYANMDSNFQQVGPHTIPAWGKSYIPDERWSYASGVELCECYIPIDPPAPPALFFVQFEDFYRASVLSHLPTKSFARGPYPSQQSDSKL